jgi:flagellin-like protein
MFLKNKKGISSIIATLLLIVLTIILVAVVWTVVNNFISPKISQSTSCYNAYNDVTLNNQYSCFNSSSNQVQFSLNIGSTSVSGVLVSISSAGQSKSFTITTTPQAISNLANYDGSQQISLPGLNSGATYIYSWSGSDVPNSVEVAPLIKGQQCSSSDSIQKLDDCELLS